MKKYYFFIIGSLMCLSIFIYLFFTLSIYDVASNIRFSGNYSEKNEIINLAIEDSDTYQIIKTWNQRPKKDIYYENSELEHLKKDSVAIGYVVRQSNSQLIMDGSFYGIKEEDRLEGIDTFKTKKNIYRIMIMISLCSLIVSAYFFVKKKKLSVQIMSSQTSNAEV